jgi:hypothetical protein
MIDLDRLIKNNKFYYGGMILMGLLMVFGIWLNIEVRKEIPSTQQTSKK